jgi:predicted TIM-barrel enzyme
LLTATAAAAAAAAEAAATLVTGAATTGAAATGAAATGAAASGESFTLIGAGTTPGFPHGHWGAANLSTVAAYCEKSGNFRAVT